MPLEITIGGRDAVGLPPHSPSSRPSAARAGTHEHRPVIMGPRLRGDDRIEENWVRLAKTAVGFVWPKCIPTIVVPAEHSESRDPMNTGR